MYLLDLAATWFLAVPLWQAAVVYFFGAVLFGSINKRLQRWRCHEATTCRNWNYDVCPHNANGVLGYVLWPILLPVSIIYSLVELDWGFVKNLRDKMSSKSR